MSVFHGITAILLTAVFSLQYTELSAQNEPDQQIIQTLDALDQISSYGDYNSFDSAAKRQVVFAIGICKQYLNQKLDSLTRSMFLYHKGRLEYVRKNYDSARSDLEKALNLDVANYPALERLCLLSKNHFREYHMRRFYINASIELWNLKTQYDSLNPFMWYYLSKTYELQFQYENTDNRNKVKSLLKHCMQLDSNNANYIFEYALYIPEDKRLPLLKKALLKEENWLYRSHILAWYKHRKRYKELLKFADESILLYESQFPFYYSFLENLWKQKADIYKAQKNHSAYNYCIERVKYYAARQGS